MKIAEGSCLEKPWKVDEQYGLLTKKEAAKNFVVLFSLWFIGIQKNTV